MIDAPRVQAGAEHSEAMRGENVDEALAFIQPPEGLRVAGRVDVADPLLVRALR